MNLGDRMLYCLQSIGLGILALLLIILYVWTRENHKEVLSLIFMIMTTAIATIMLGFLLRNLF